jgi:argininosuccinate synthase
MLRAAAIYEGGYLLGTSIARPLIAKKQMELAQQEGADAVAHGATGKGNDQIRFELTYLSMNPHIQIIAPWREWSFQSRQELIQYAKDKQIPITVTPEKPYSIDRNLFHISFEGGVLEDPWNEPPREMFRLTTDPEEAKDTPETLELAFEGGNPKTLNGKAFPPVALLETLNQLAGEHGIGRVDLVENRYIGMKSRGVYETPGGTLLHEARKALESITLDREVLHLRDSLVPRYSELVYYGYWFSPERELLQKTMDDIQKQVTGTVRMKLYKGNCTVLGRKSPRSLYRQQLASFDQGLGFNPRDAEGFIRLNALRLITQWEEKKGRKD